VDVRDVADPHMRAMIDPQAKGERFLAIAGDFVSMREIALVVATAESLVRLGLLKSSTGH
jgi:nucleoside-diphosphate-sugar epimerase